MTTTFWGKELQHFYGNRDLVVCAIDGTQTFNTENDYRNHHSSVVLSTVGNLGVKLVVDFERAKLYPKSSNIV